MDYSPNTALDAAVAVDLEHNYHKRHADDNNVVVEQKIGYNNQKKW